jgi:hypothetical protein
LERRRLVANIRADSFASVPEVVKQTRASGMPESRAIFSASSTCWRIRYSVEVCTTPVLSWRSTASRTSAMS